MRWLRMAVQRWGGRAVGIAVTGIGLYVVAPSVITLFGAWPDLERVRPWWFVVLSALQIASFATLWLLLRISLPHARWRDIAASQAVGNAVSKVFPGGAATGGVMQGRMLVVAGVRPARSTTALSATGLLTTGVLLALPVLTVPALLIGPPPARKLEYGLFVSFVLARGRDGARHRDAQVGPVRHLDRPRRRPLIHLVRRRITVDSVERHCTPSGTRWRRRSRAAGPGGRRRGGQPDVRLRLPGGRPVRRRRRDPAGPRAAGLRRSRWASGWSRSPPAGWGSSRPA